MKFSKGKSRFKVSADGKGIVSHAGTALLRELAADTGLVKGWTAALIDTYSLPPTHAPGQVLVDLAVSIADGGDALRHLRTLRDQAKLFGPVASDPTAWRVVDKVDTVRLDLLRAARAEARERAWAAGAGPDLSKEVWFHFDASLLTAHSDKENAAPTWKKGFGFHPLLCYLDRPDVSGGEALAGLLRPGNAGSNTAADHVKVLDLAIAALPANARPQPGEADGPKVMASADSAGATHVFAAALRARGIGFSLGFAVDENVQQAILALPETIWTPAYNADGEPRRGAWVAELTGLLNLANWPEGSRVIVRRERPHPGAQLTFSDIDGHRFTAFLTDTPHGQLPDLEMQHRSHARVEDRIRTGKDTGMRNLPFFILSPRSGRGADLQVCVVHDVVDADVCWLGSAWSDEFLGLSSGRVAAWRLAGDAGGSRGSEGFGERLAKLAVVFVKLADPFGGRFESAEQGCVRCPLLVRCRWQRRGCSTRTQLLDLGSYVGLGVEPGSGDACFAGHGLEGDW